MYNQLENWLSLKFQLKSQYCNKILILVPVIQFCMLVQCVILRALLQFRVLSLYPWVLSAVLDIQIYFGLYSERRLRGISFIARVLRDSFFVYFLFQHFELYRYGGISSNMQGSFTYIYSKGWCVYMHCAGLGYSISD